MTRLARAVSPTRCWTRSTTNAREARARRKAPAGSCGTRRRDQRSSRTRAGGAAPWVFRVPVPREHELAAAATGARPATPAPAAFAAALAAAETYKLAQSTTAKR